MRWKKLLSAWFVVLLLLTSAAQSATLTYVVECLPREQMFNTLTEEFGEQLVWVKKLDEEALLEGLRSSKTGTWSVLLSGSDGTSCLILSGGDIESERTGFTI